jgi:hypothetical protein
VPGEVFYAGADAFVDAAAVMQNLDLIITCGTSIAHRAGALGVARPDRFTPGSRESAGPTKASILVEKESRKIRELQDAPQKSTPAAPVFAIFLPHSPAI